MDDRFTPNNRVFVVGVEAEGATVCVRPDGSQWLLAICYWLLSAG